MSQCPHSWVLPGIWMPESYWKPTGPPTCRFCGAWQLVKTEIRTFPGPQVTLGTSIGRPLTDDQPTQVPDEGERE